MSGSKYHFHTLTKERLAAFFREMADRMEGISSDDPAFDMNPGDWKKLKIGIKKEPDGYALKVTVKSDHREQPLSRDGGEDSEVSYKRLKKRMKRDFEAIGEAMLSGRVPETETVTTFLDDSRRMMTFPDRGASCYDAFSAAIDSFRKAYNDNDLQAMTDAFREIDRNKKECHDRYK